MILKFIVFTLIALVTPKVLPTIKVKGLGSAVVVAIVFGLLNLLLGWLLRFVVGIITIPFVIITLGLFSFLIPTIINAILLKLTDALLDSFEIKGWLPAFIMGFFFAVGGYVAERL